MSNITKVCGWCGQPLNHWGEPPEGPETCEQVYGDICRICRREIEGIVTDGVCPKCVIDLEEEKRIQEQEDIDDYWDMIREGLSS